MSSVASTNPRTEPAGIDGNQVTSAIVVKRAHWAQLDPAMVLLEYVVAEDLEAEHVPVELQRLVRVAHRNAGKSDMRECHSLRSSRA